MKLFLIIAVSIFSSDVFASYFEWYYIAFEKGAKQIVISDDETSFITPKQTFDCVIDKVDSVVTNHQGKPIVKESRSLRCKKKGIESWLNLMCSSSFEAPRTIDMYIKDSNVSKHSQVIQLACRNKNQP